MVRSAVISPKFWLLIALALAVHACCWTLVLLRMERAPLLLMGLAVGPEQMALLTFLNRFLTDNRS